MDKVDDQRRRVEQLYAALIESHKVLEEIGEEFEQVKNRLTQAMSQEKSIQDDYNQAVAEYQLLLRSQK